jgi:hypothetical protein
MKKIAALIAASLITASANAAIFNVVAGSKITAPLAVNGIAAEASGSNDLTALWIGDIQIGGTIETGPGFSIISMNLYQIGSVTATSVTGNPSLSFEVSGLTWTYNQGPINSSGFQGAAGNNLIQTGGTATCLGAGVGNVQCESIVNSINGTDAFPNGAQRSNSALSFDGRRGDVNERLRLWDAEEGEQYTTTPAATQGMVFGGVGFGPGVDAILTYNLFGWGQAGSTTNSQFNSIYQAQGVFAVVEAPEIPVPAAAWLMGSGLVGLAGIARRRKMA